MTDDPTPIPPSRGTAVLGVSRVAAIYSGPGSKSRAIEKAFRLGAGSYCVLPIGRISFEELGMFADPAAYPDAFRVQTWAVYFKPQTEPE